MPVLALAVRDRGELHELLGQIEEAPDLGVLNGLPGRLSGLLEAHFAQEEAADGVFEVFCRADREKQRDVPTRVHVG